ncbi:Vps5-domain-containing protein [Agrocybe pediades]|nr:Vps5-domain-containing protein [Agrocybe pediades]
MDGFDDLLNPSRQALEDNPFANPFAKRSSSPDPWAMPFASNESENAFGDGTEHFGSSETPFGASSTSHDFGASDASGETTEESDPLDSAERTAETDDDEDNKPLASVLSPGFRESIAQPAPTPFSETATIRPAHIEEFSQEDRGAETAAVAETRTSDTGATHSSESSNISSAIPSHIQQTTSWDAGSTSGSTSAIGSGFQSPLDTPFGGRERSIAGLSLGGEVASGWHTEEQTPWQSEPVLPSVAAKPPPINVDDDSDDDKPILQAYQKQRETSVNASTGLAPRSDKGIQPVFTISVDDPQKVGDPIRSFTMYTVHTRTTSPLYQKSSFSVLRRFSDFLWLYETLSNNNPGVVVPPTPEKNPFGRFDDQFVKQRRLALEKCIQKTANHPVLMKDPDLKLFLESDTFALDIKHRKAEIAHERGGLIASIGQSITGPRFHETDDWFDRQKVYLDSLESQLRGLVKAIELVSKHRTELAAATGEFAQNVSDLSSSDIAKQLAQSLSGLADVERKAQELQTTQAEQDLVTISATVDEYARLINSVRLAFSSRIRVFHAWKNQENELLRTKQTHEKNRAQGKIPTDRLGYSLTQIAEAERRASDAKLEYEQVSKLVKLEVARFEQERIEDFKDSLQNFLEGMISRQKELISTWEKYQQMLLTKVGGGGPAVMQATRSSTSTA